MVDKKEISKKDQKALEDSINKAIKKLKPRNTSSTSSKSSVTRTKNKAIEPTKDLKDIKQMIKEEKISQIENAYYDKTLRDLDRELFPEKYRNPTLQNNNKSYTPGQIQLSNQMRNVKQNLMDRIPPEDLKNMDERQFQQIAKAELLRQNPGMAYANNQGNVLKDSMEVVSTLLDKVQPPPQPNNDFLIGKVLELVQNQQINQPQPPNIQEQIANLQQVQQLIQPQNNSNSNDLVLNYISSQLDKVLEENKYLREKQIKDLKEQASTDPADVLEYYTNLIEKIKGGNVLNSGPQDIENKIRLMQIEHKFNLENHRIQQELDEKKREARRSEETLDTVKTTIETVADKAITLFGQIFGNSLQQNMVPLGQQQSIQPQMPQYEQPTGPVFEPQNMPENFMDNFEPVGQPGKGVKITPNTTQYSHGFRMSKPTQIDEE